MRKDLTPAERERIVQDLRKLTQLMDYSIEVPGTGYRFGLDPLLGLIPGIGDTLSMAISAYIVVQARRLGVSRWVLTRMVGNIALDALVGSVPLLGDAFDFAFKANKRNLRLLKLDPDVIDVTARPLK
jgi:hypothetical protein